MQRGEYYHDDGCYDRCGRGVYAGGIYAGDGVYAGEGVFAGGGPKRTCTAFKVTKIKKTGRDTRRCAKWAPTVAPTQALIPITQAPIRRRALHGTEANLAAAARNPWLQYLHAYKAQTGRWAPAEARPGYLAWKKEHGLVGKAAQGYY